MLIAAAKYTELARINLSFAKAELTVYGDDQRHIRQALEHIEEADEYLRKLVPEFEFGHANKNIEAA